MKNLLAALFLICGLAARAQTFTPIHNYQQPDGLSVFKYFGIPYGPTPQLNVTRLVPGAIFYNTTDTTMYSWTGTQWIKAGTGGGVVVSPGDGIDSITLRNNTICQWKAGVSTCYDMNLFFTEVGLSADRLRLIFYNFMGDSLKTVTLPHTIAEQGAGMVLTRRGDTVNFASTATGGSGGGIDSVYASISGDTLIFTYSSGRVDRFKFVGAAGGISKILPGQYQLAVNDSTTKVDSNFVVIKKEFFNPGVIPFADLSGTGLLTHNFGGLGWDGTNIIIGANDPNTLAGALLNGSRAKIQAWFYGLRFQVGITGDTDPTKEYNFFNANGTTPLLRIYSTGTGPYKHHSIFNTDAIFRDLSTDSTAPSTTGTLKMVVTDAAGKLSWQAIPTPGSSVSITPSLGISTSPNPITGSGSVALDTAATVVLSRQRALATYQALITFPNSTNQYHTGYNTFGSFRDTVRASISLTTTGTGAATYTTSTGILNIPTPSAGSGGQQDSAYFWQKTGDYLSGFGKYLGTNNNTSLIFKTFGGQRMKLDSLGYLTYGSGAFPATATYPVTITGTTKIISITAAGSPVFAIYNYLNSTAIGTWTDDGVITTTAFAVSGLPSFSKFKDDALTSYYSASDVSFAVKAAGTSKPYIGKIQNSNGTNSMQWFNTTAGQVKVGGTTGNDSTNFQNPGSSSSGYTAITSTTTMTNVDAAGTLDCTSGTFTITLPATIRQTGRDIRIVNSGSGTITIQTAGIDTFRNVSGTPTSITIVGLGTRVLQGNGSTGWNLISSL